MFACSIGARTTICRSPAKATRGLFGLRRDAYLVGLHEYDAIAPVGDATRERNFLPFIPWLAGRKAVRTFALTDAREAVGVNTTGDLAIIESYLRERA